MGGGDDGIPAKLVPYGDGGDDDTVIGIDETEDW